MRIKVALLAGIRVEEKRGLLGTREVVAGVMVGFVEPEREVLAEA